MQKTKAAEVVALETVKVVRAYGRRKGSATGRPLSKDEIKDLGWLRGEIAESGTRWYMLHKLNTNQMQGRVCNFVTIVATIEQAAEGRTDANGDQ